VERVRPADARDDLLRLWATNLQLESSAEAKYAWLYQDAPINPEDVWLLRATLEGAVSTVGTAGVGVRRFQVGEGATDVTAGLLADLAVDKAHRSVGPALGLVRAVKESVLGKGDAPGVHAFAYGFPNALAEGVFKRVGYQVLGVIGRYARVLRHAEYAARVRELELSRVPPAARELLYKVAEQPFLAAMAGAAVDMAQLARRSPAAVESARRLRVEHVPMLDGAAVDVLWARARGEHAVVAHRTGAVLAWRFPVEKRRTWYAAYSRDSRRGLRAYALVERHDDGVAHLKDLFGHRSDMVGLLDLLPGLVYRTGATALSMRYLGAGWLKDALLERGFAERESTRMIAVGATESVKHAVMQPERWHLTDFDEDV
jgi:hypothetical protein